MPAILAFAVAALTLWILWKVVAKTSDALYAGKRTWLHTLADKSPNIGGAILKAWNALKNPRR